MKSLKHILLFLLGMAILSCSGTGTGNPLSDELGTISGKLTTSNSAGTSGSAASAATVRVYSGESILTTATADSGGNYSVEIAPGNYTIEFEAIGSRKRRHNVNVIKKSRLTVDDVLLSRPGEVVGGAIGNLILFAGSDYTTGIVDGYNVVDGSHFTANLSEARRYIATATIGTNIYFVGGYKSTGVTAVVDIYDTSSNTWSTQNLSTARLVDEVTAIGTKLIVGGGADGSSSNALTEVEIIDTTSWTISTKTLSTGRHWSATVSVGTKAYIIGGGHCWVIPGCANNSIDIYDSATDSISTITMPRYRHHHKAVVIGTKIYIGGGQDENDAPLSVVDILETSNNTWTSTTMTTAPGQSTVAGALGSYVLFAGGDTTANPYSNVISLYDTSTGTWSELNMSQGRYNIGLAIANGKAYLAGGNPASGGETDLIEVVDATVPSVSIFSKAWF